MANRELPSPSLLRQLLSYDPESGKLFWLPRRPDAFAPSKYSPERRCKTWNSANAGKEAFTYRMKHGHRQGSINDQLLLAHRVVWAWMTGAWPEADIDHINGDPTDNRWVNLRSVTHAINTRNSAGKSNNSSGATGVDWRPDKRKWRARVMVNGKERSLGHFDSFEDAVSAREAALLQDGFTKRHGALR